MAGVLHIELRLKYEHMSFAACLWSVIAPALGLKTIPDLVDTNSTHTDIAYAYLTAHTPVTTWAIGHAARSRKYYL